MYATQADLCKLAKRCVNDMREPYERKNYFYDYECFQWINHVSKEDTQYTRLKRFKRYKSLVFEWHLKYI